VAGSAAVAIALFTSGYEGIRNTVYKDPAGISTVCAGHAYTGPDGKPLKAGATYSDDVCSYLLGQDIATAQKAVKSLAKVPLTAGEDLAYTDFTFNVGQGNFARSTILRDLNSANTADVRFNAGRHEQACKGLAAWVYSGGKKLAGLVKRRAAEEKACLGR
jgi:lysozyme